MTYDFLPRNYNKESSITSRCRILPSFYYPTNHFGIQTYKDNQMGPNISLKQFAHLSLVLDGVNHPYLSLSKSAVKPTSRSLTILASFYSSASIWGLEKNAVQLPLCKTLTHILITNQQLPLSPNNSLLQCQLYCCCHMKDSWSSLPLCLAEEST